MHDLRMIREAPDRFDQGLQRRGLAPLSAHILDLDSRRRAAQTALQEMLTRRNAVSKQVGAANLAAVVIEPMPANNGLLVQREAFLQHLRKRCDEHGALLIFDEVITGFRFVEGGITGHVGVTPDLVALGKVIGGGLPVGAWPTLGRPPSFAPGNAFTGLGLER